MKIQTLYRVLSGFLSSSKTNANSDRIEAAFQNTLSLDGSAPNSMQSTIDMDSNKIINLGAPTNNLDAATKLYVDTVAFIGTQGPVGATGPTGATGATGATGLTGASGAPGDLGWSPILAVVTDGSRRVLQVIDWTGGTGTEPTTGLYVGAAGLTSVLADAIDIRGAQGAAGAGTGDMLGANNLSDVASPSTSRTNLGLGTAATHAHTEYSLAAHTHVIADVTDITAFGASLINDADAATARATLELGTAATSASTAFAAASHSHTAANISDPTNIKSKESFIFALSDESTALTSGTAKVTFRMPYAFTITDVRSSLNTASSSGLVTVDINEGGTTILSTKLSIDAGEKTSTTAATPPVISDATIADDAEITMDIDASGTGAKGLKVVIIGQRT